MVNFKTIGSRTMPLEEEGVEAEDGEEAAEGSVLIFKAVTTEISIIIALVPVLDFLITTSEAAEGSIVIPTRVAISVLHRRLTL